jgi:hypothetical protein
MSSPSIAVQRARRQFTTVLSLLQDNAELNDGLESSILPTLLDASQRFAICDGDLAALQSSVLDSQPEIQSYIMRQLRDIFDALDECIAHHDPCFLLSYCSSESNSFSDDSCRTVCYYR